MLSHAGLFLFGTFVLTCLLLVAAYLILARIWHLPPFDGYYDPEPGEMMVGMAVFDGERPREVAHLECRAGEVVPLWMWGARQVLVSRYYEPIDHDVRHRPYDQEHRRGIRIP